MEYWIFWTKSKEALKDNDMREYITETKDAIGTEGYSSSGLSARRAKEANLIGKNLSDWNPIVKVEVSGTRKNLCIHGRTQQVIL